MPLNASLTDVWTELKKGNRDALLVLYKSHYVGLMNYGLKLTGNRMLTKDCITQVLLRLWDNRHKLPDVQNIRSYLLTCMRNELLTELKSESARTARIKGFQNAGERSELSYEEYIISVQTDKEQKDKLARAMEKLTSREKELLKMKYFEDKGYDELAEECGITKRTAYNIIHAALKTLKANLTHQQKDRLIHIPVILFLIMVFF